MHSLGGSVSGAGGSQQFQGIASAGSYIPTPGETDPAQVIGTTSVSLERQSEDKTAQWHVVWVSSQQIIKWSFQERYGINKDTISSR